MKRAVVFAYHNVGVRCLKALFARDIDVALVVTHRDNPNEAIWFESVAELAELHDIRVIAPEDPNSPEIVEQIAALQPDFLFSFYYRLMLKKPLLDLPKMGAYNMHGSLLPKYRGRVPVNWAIIKGETESGATLHRMTEKPDNGHIVDQLAVPILPDDTALELFNKVTCAAEMVLHRSLPALIAGTAQETPQDLSQGGYFGGRRPEDGRIDWQRMSAQEIHNLVRALAPPYPGAFSEAGGKRLLFFKTIPERRAARFGSATLYSENGRCYADCADGRVLRIVSFEIDSVVGAASVLGTSPIPLC